MFENQSNSIPTHGYIFEKWGQYGYRSTAHAYMKREGVNFIENLNGKFYSLSQIEENLIGFKK